MPPPLTLPIVAVGLALAAPLAYLWLRHRWWAPAAEAPTPSPWRAMDGPHLGDIMGMERAVPEDLDVALQPMERIILTANGNLQRIMSAYYNEPVTVRLQFNRCTEPGHYERQVTLHCLGKQFCTATSTVVLSDPAILQAVQCGKVGIGQLFRQFDLLPRFTLLEAGLHPRQPDVCAAADTALWRAGLEGGGGWWRLYLLQARGVACRIREEFPGDVLEAPRGRLPTSPNAKEEAANLGDIMGMQTDCCIPGAAFSPLERILLTANGNVQRIMSSYYHAAVRVRVRAVARQQPGLYHREVDMSCFGETFMVAHSTLHITDPGIVHAIEEGKVLLGAIFRSYDMLPRFRLINAGRNEDDGFWRLYELSATGISCEIREDFRPHLFHLEAPTDPLASLRSPSGSPTIPSDMLRVTEVEVLPSPAALRATYPVPPAVEKAVLTCRLAVRNVLARLDRRLMVVLGPPTIHCTAEALDYAQWFVHQSQRFAEDLILILGTDFAEPRPAGSWKGLLKDPDACGGDNVPKGLRTVRELLLQIGALGACCGGELVDPMALPYYADLLAWTFIGPQSVGSTMHMQLASSLPCPVGCAAGAEIRSLQAATDAMRGTMQPQTFLSPSPEGLMATVFSSGNKDVHLVLQEEDTYDGRTVQRAYHTLTTAHLPPNLVVDLRHRLGAGLQHDLHQLGRRIGCGDADVVGVLLHSGLVEGSQAFQFGRPLAYGQSVARPCVGPAQAEEALATLAAAAAARRALRRSARPAPR